MKGGQRTGKWRHKLEREGAVPMAVAREGQGEGSFHLLPNTR